MIVKFSLAVFFVVNYFRYIIIIEIKEAAAVHVSTSAFVSTTWTLSAW